MVLSLVGVGPQGVLPANRGAVVWNSLRFAPWLALGACGVLGTLFFLQGSMVRASP